MEMLGNVVDFKVGADGVAIVTFVDEVEKIRGESLCQKIGSYLRDLLAQGYKRFAIGFGKLTAVDSAFIGKLLGVTRDVRLVGGEVALFGLGEGLKEVFVEVLRLDKVFAIHNTESEAVQFLVS